MKFKLLMLLLPVGYISNAQKNQEPISGKIVHIENFQSKIVDPRYVDIWLPDNYDGKKKFAVLYMHDGQMLFDSTTTWNHQTWDVDDVASKLLKEKRVKDFIVVGIWNTGTKRHADYFPQKPFDNLAQSDKDTVINQLKKSLQTNEIFKPNSDNYLKFIVNELKPFIDKNYAVSVDRENTLIAGSSMGGLISLYALCEYPEIFGGAACLSTHWTGSFATVNNPIPDAFINYIDFFLPSPKNHKIYFDCGDMGIDKVYPAIQGKIDLILKKKGFSIKNWITSIFIGKDHSEKSWNERLDIPLYFLLKK